MNNHLNTNSHQEPQAFTTELDEKLFQLNIPGSVIEVTATEADELGAFEEDALSEEEAFAATELSAEDKED
ncbi:hypothetical protein JQC92_18300 [Shewanella sp. 202IG2-18]|uniref:hypothetical protein n=1 Tax=Parashewanella hymeniacidonis TaxID=2807618 RepID=UPI0019601FDD|nr:hypothetical protein [Parashewanella hymeniacidonis]MBM7073962.1 hypothetical protein [Parashewanella hymeniacidonis]